jgi:hypothetical protein
MIDASPVDSKVLPVRADAETLARIDRIEKELRTRGHGLEVNRSVTLRVLLRAGLDSKELEFGIKSADADQGERKGSKR